MSNKNNEAVQITEPKGEGVEEVERIVRNAKIRVKIAKENNRRLRNSRYK